MTDRHENIRKALDGLRERCAREAERVTGRRRVVAAFVNSEAVKPCEVAAAIRKIDVQQYYECAAMEIDLLVSEWKRVAAAQAELHGEAEERAEQLAEDDAWCAECGVKLENVRPGKHQHPTCSQAQPLTDEALLRQALEALELRCGTHADERKKLIPALRERLWGKA